MWIVDPFERLVTEAKDRLSEREGQEVSWRELARRAGYDEAREWGVFRNAIRPQRGRRPEGQRSEGRRPNPEVVRRLAKVLPVSELELNQAAAETAGYLVVHATGTGKSASIASLVAMYLDDDSVSEEERESRAKEVLVIITDRAPQIVQAEAPDADVVEFPRRRYLAEAGAAAREGEAKQDLSDPDGSVD